jgi:hypothetical protein
MNKTAGKKKITRKLDQIRPMWDIMGIDCDDVNAQIMDICHSIIKIMF